MQSNKNYQKISKWLDNTLIFSGALLLGIWSVPHTIALRNILLYLCIIVILINIIFAKKHEKVFNYFILNKKNIGNLPPLIAILLLLTWLLIHLLYIGDHYAVQLAELSGTWLRAFVGAIVGFFIAYSLQSNNEKYIYIVAGLFSPFLFLLLEYIPSAIRLKSFFLPYYFYDSIFAFKTNASLAGIIFISTIVSISIWSLHNKKQLLKNQLLFTLISVMIVLYGLAVIMETRNGFAICFSIICLSFIYYVYYLLSNQNKPSKLEFLIILIVILNLLALISIHLYISPQWKMFLADFRVAIDTEKIINWQNTEFYGYPKNYLNIQVSPSTYERVAWFKVGMMLIFSDMLGGGVLNNPFINIVKLYYPNAEVKSTLSGWMDLIYSIGFPGFLLLIFSIIYPVIRAKNRINLGSYLTFTLGLVLLLSFSVSEFGSKHGVEILLFYAGFFAANTIISCNNLRTPKI